MRYVERYGIYGLVRRKANRVLVLMPHYLAFSCDVILGKNYICLRVPRWVGTGNTEYIVLSGPKGDVTFIFPCQSKKKDPIAVFLC